MRHGRVTRQQAHHFVVRLWTLRAAPIGLLLIAIGAAATLSALPAIGICLVALVSVWHLHRYHRLNLGLASLHALQSRRHRSNQRGS